MLSLPLSAILVSLSMCDVYVCVEGGGGENGPGKRDGGVEWIASLLVCRYDMLYKWKDYA